MTAPPGRKGIPGTDEELSEGDNPEEGVDPAALGSEGEDGLDPEGSGFEPLLDVEPLPLPFPLPAPVVGEPLGEVVGDWGFEGWVVVVGVWGGDAP